MTKTVEFELNIATAADMHALGVQLGKTLQAGDLMLLTGQLGAGKTTLTRGVGEGLNVRGPVTSPTFVLARTHPSLCGGPQLVHVDAYRLQDSCEFEDLDIDFSRSVVVAEWGAGLVDQEAVALELVIERPTGDIAPDIAGESWDELDAAQLRRVLFRVHSKRLQELDFSEFKGGD